MTRETVIEYACMGWLPWNGWPLPFRQVRIPRGLGRGLVDVGATRSDFSEACAIEVKVAARAGDAEGQLMDALRAAEFVYLAAPHEVWRAIRVPKVVGILEPVDWPPRGRRSRDRQGLLKLSEVRKPTRTTPEPALRRDFLHALMRESQKMGRFPTDVSVQAPCPACGSGHCYSGPGRVFHEIEDSDLFEEDLTRKGV